jgi:aromatic-L-amino-acid/L-tryptophan decarboxylase
VIRPQPLSLGDRREPAVAAVAAGILDAWHSFDAARPSEPGVDPRLERLLTMGLPAGGDDVVSALADAAHVLDRSLAQPRPRWFGFVGSSGLEVGVLADALASCYDVNLASWAAAATRIEEQAAQWVAEFIGYPAAVGTFTSGGTVSNLAALAAARTRALPGARERGLSDVRCAVYCSQEAHHSIRRTAELLGIGGDGVRALPIDDRRRLQPEAVAEAIRGDRRAGVVPVAVVATAGTTLTGAVDPIDDLADIAATAGVWLHVDGAYGAPAASVPALESVFAGLERADSVSLDAHKWLFVPKACGLLLTRDRADMEAAFAHVEDYFPHERGQPHAADVTLEYSRPFRALKVWLAFRVHGADALRAAIEDNVRIARGLWEELRDAADMAPLAEPPVLSIVPYRPLPAGLSRAAANRRVVELARALQDDGRVWVASATIDGDVYLRPCVVNYRTSAADASALIEVTRDVLTRGATVSPGG